MSDETTPGWTPPGQEPAPPSEPTVPGGSVPPPPTLPTQAGASEPRLPSGPPAAPLGSGGAIPPPPPITEPAAEDDAAGGSGRSKKVLIGAVVGVLAIGGAGVFAVSQMSDDNSGGAASPQELGEAVMASLDQEDFLGVIDLLLPGERETFGEPAQEFFDELRRLEVLDDGASLEGFDGFDVVLEDRSVSEAGTNVDDIVNITMRADASVTINGEELPFGDFLEDNLGEELQGVDDVQETTSGLEFEFPVTAVEQNGRWYLSMMYSIAENARQASGIGDIPEVGIVPKGGESPEAAIGVVLDGIEQLDLSALIGAINPNEAEALQRYAPLFLGDAQASLDEIPMAMEFTDVEYRVTGSGSTRSVFVEGFHLQGEISDPSGESTETLPFTADFKDGCYSAEANGEKVEACPDTDEGLDQIGTMLSELGADEAFDELKALYDDVLADYEQPGITVKQVDGLWYVSPIATAFDQFFAVTHALDREEIDRAIDTISEAVASAGQLYRDEDFGDFDELIEGEDPVVDTIPADTIPADTIPVDTITEDTVPEEFAEAEEAYSACLLEATAEEAAACIEQGIADGTIPEYYLPVELEFLECGLGDIAIGKVSEYDLSDEEYTTLLVGANECFVALIAAGSVEEYLVPPEYLRPECAENRNPWSFEEPQDGLFDRWLDCIYE